MLLSLKGSKLSAKEASLLAFWACGAGAEGEARALAYPPNRGTGHYSEHWDKALGGRPTDDVYHHVTSPVFHRYDATIDQLELPTIPVHVAIVEEWRSKDCRAALAKAIENGDLGDVYAEHPVVLGKADGEIVWAYALYVDGFSYRSHDNIIAYWVHSLPTRRRHLVAVVRAQELCSCGCRGWCTVYPIWLMLAWSMEAVQTGRWPTTREGEKAWRDTDGFWAALGGNDLGLKAVCCFVKVDLKEVATSLGFAGVSTKESPCSICCCTQADWDELTGLSALEHGWPPFTLEVFEAHTRPCEKRVRLGPADYSTIRALLEPDNRKQGNRGRCLTKAVPSLGLEAGDRLEPSPELPNTAAFDELRPGAGESLTVVFWRKSRETKVRRRNPIWSERTHFSPHRNLAADNLHLLSLGVTLYWINAVLHQLIADDAYGTKSTTKRERELGTLAALKQRMGPWRSAEAQAGRQRTLPGNFTEGMLGAPGGPVGLQGAESNDVCTFLVQAALPELRGKLVGERWGFLLECGDMLVRMLLVLKVHKGAVPVKAHKDFVDSWLTFCRNSRLVKIPYVPKSHWIAHLCVQLGYLGSSAAAGTWRDEQANGELREMAEHAHEIHWHARVLSEWRRR